MASLKNLKVEEEKEKINLPLINLPKQELTPKTNGHFNAFRNLKRNEITASDIFHLNAHNYSKVSHSF
jgi:hypothetical protein